MRWTVAAVLAAAATLAGCSSVGGIVGAVTGTAAAVGSGNPAVGAAVGVGTRAAADYGIRYASRRWHRTEQDALATAVGTMTVGEARPWEVRHALPFGNAQGEVRVLRAIATPLAECKEVLFSVVSGEATEATRQWFVTSACRQAEGWKWAAAEPATERWGSLH
ncbi:MAG: hypothetical protein EON48_10760 [Acetobacteraceae bacterium]|nr:MAG: hypothetical protein EON48_10760 [Acetobacteraceae bacterium]